MMYVGRPLPDLLRDLLAIADAIGGDLRRAPLYRQALIDLKSELDAWKDASRFPEWILLGALASLAQCEFTVMAEVSCFQRIANDARTLTIVRLDLLLRQRGQA